jgi:tetratricopeptide (TPR) repeat protein
LRFRASEEFNDIIRDTAREFGVPVVPMNSTFELNSPHGLMGKNLFLEHLHPNIDGYFLMADAYFEHMKSHGLISSNWDSTRIKPSSHYRRHWGFSALDSIYADLSIFYLKGGWPFKADFSPNDALQRYSPTTKAESLAVVILVDDKTSLERGHVELAKYYLRTGHPDRALEEYESLYHMIPFEIDFYRGAVTSLLQLQRYDRALEVLFRSKKFLDTPFADKWIGQILLTREELERALPFLEAARAGSPDDAQLLYNLCRAYLSLNDDTRATEVLKELQRYFPQSPFIGRLIAFKRSRDG